MYAALRAHRTQTSAILFSEWNKLKQKAPLTLRGHSGHCRNIKGKPQIFGSFPSLRPPICFFSHPLGKLGVTYGLHPLLVRKHVVDFLFATTELFC